MSRWNQGKKLIWNYTDWVYAMNSIHSHLRCAASTVLWLMTFWIGSHIIRIPKKWKNCIQQRWVNLAHPTNFRISVLLLSYDILINGKQPATASRSWVLSCFRLYKAWSSKDNKGEQYIQYLITQWIAEWVNFAIQVHRSVAVLHTQAL